MTMIAHRFGFRSIDRIWNHPRNEALRRKRPNPFLLAEGDSVFIPDKTREDFDCQTNQRHVFRIRSLKQWLVHVLLDEDDRPLAGRKYELKVGGKSFAGRTDGGGVIRVEVPLDAKTAELKVWLEDGHPASCRTWNLRIGHLEPVETTFGLKGHLSNLGYDCGPANDTFDTRARQALIEFQRNHGLPETGANDGPTQNKLRELFNYPVESEA